MSPAHGQRLINQGAVLAWIILLDGRIVGSFRRVMTRQAVEIQPTLFVRLSRPERDALASAVERYGTFLGVPVILR